MVSFISVSPNPIFTQTKNTITPIQNGQDEKNVKSSHGGGCDIKLMIKY